MSSYMQGFYKPLNPKKYKGDVNNIVYRSSWELSYLMMLDKDPNVIEYSSEEVIIGYRHPISQTTRRYFVDFWVRRRNADGTETISLVEIKPAAQTRPPIITKGKRKKTILTEQITYATNQAKWEAARRVCAKKGWKFEIVTERELGR